MDSTNSLVPSVEPSFPRTHSKSLKVCDSRDAISLGNDLTLFHDGVMIENNGTNLIHFAEKFF